MNKQTKQSTKKSNTKKKRRGRPEIPEQYRKRTRTIRIANHVWDEVEKFGGGSFVNGVELFADLYTPCIVNPLEDSEED